MGRINWEAWNKTPPSKKPSKGGGRIDWSTVQPTPVNPQGQRQPIQIQKPKGVASFILPSLRETLFTKRGLKQVAQTVPSATTEALPLIKNVVEFVRVAFDSKKEIEQLNAATANRNRLTNLIQEKLKTATPEQRIRLRTALNQLDTVDLRETMPEALRSTGETATTALGRTVQTGAVLANPALRGVSPLLTLGARGSAGLAFGAGKVIEERQGLQKAVPTLALAGGTGLAAGGLEVGARGVSAAIRNARSAKPQVTPQTVTSTTPQIVKKQITPSAAITTPPTSGQRGFAQTVIGAKGTKAKVASGIDSTYEPITNRQTVAAVRQSMKNTTVDDALQQLRQPGPVTAQRTVQGMVLIKKLQASGRIDDAIDLIERLAKELTAQGQSIQAASLYGRLTSAGALRFAQRTINQINRDTARKLGVDVNSLAGKQLLKLSPELANKIANQANALQSIPEGLPRTVEIGKLMRDISSVIPSGAGRKASTLQIIAQLGNPKTLLRNIVGNVGFAGTETANRPVRVVIDKLISALTKQRTASFAGGKQEILGGVEGARLGALEAKHSIRIGELTTQLDLPTQRTFHKGILGFLEKGLDWGLRLPDRIGYQAAAKGKMAELKALVASGKSKLTPEQIAEIADNYGKYRTFQDLSPAAIGLSKIKSGLNFGKEFGGGDLVIKYPKISGNLLARAVDFSLLGFVRAITKFTNLISGRIHNKAWSPQIQGEAVDALSRAITGSVGLVGTGAALKSVGLLTRTKKETDKDLSALEREVGTGPYRINVDGLWRYVKSGFNKEEAKLRNSDRLMSYDWFQPNAVMLAMGARMADREPGAPSISDTIINSLAEGVNTIAEQPLVTGIKRLFGPGDVVKGVTNALLASPASFVPTALNQLGQVLDNKQRETYSNIWWQEMYNEVARKIPGLKSTVPPRINIFGREAQQYQEGSNSVFNVFFNPAFLSVYQPTEMSKEIVRLYEATGEKTHIPSLVSRKQTINGVEKELSPKEYEDMQRYVGAWNTKLFIDRMSQPDWNGESDTDKQKELKSIAEDTRSAARIKLLGHKPDKVSGDVQKILNQKTPEPLQPSERREVSKESKERAGNVIKFLRDYGKALKTDPGQTMRALFTPERLRKVRGNAVVLERKVDLGNLDLGDPRSAVDHILPLAIGGTNNLSNLQILSNDEKSKKDAVERKLIKLLEDNKIGRKEAQKRIRNWRSE